MDECLAELKHVNLCKTWYPLPNATHSRSPREACNARGKIIPREYVTKADALDRKYPIAPQAPAGAGSDGREHAIGESNGPSQPAKGRVRRRLEQLAGTDAKSLLPLVFGPFNDVNDGFEKLINAMAAHGAAIMWRPMMAPTPAAAYGALHWKLRRTIGMAMHRANADLILHRIPRIGSRTASARCRRNVAREAFFHSSGPSATYARYQQAQRGHYVRAWH